MTSYDPIALELASPGLPAGSYAASCDDMLIKKHWKEKNPDAGMIVGITFAVIWGVLFFVIIATSIWQRKRIAKHGASIRRGMSGRFAPQAQARVVPGIAPPADDGFQAAPAYAGPRPGYSFKTGPRGTGYYREVVPVVGVEEGQGPVVEGYVVGAEQPPTSSSGAVRASRAFAVR